MKTLELLRHAKSSWDDDDLDDHDRPLSPRGERAAAALALALEHRGNLPRAVLCSTAVRTRETLERLARKVALPNARFEYELYLATPRALLERIRRVEDDVDSLLVVGHNPGLHELALDLAGAGPSGHLDRLAHKMPTGALVTLRFETSRWRDLAHGSGELIEFIRPRDLV